MANAAASARVYTVDPLDHLQAERDADDRGREIIGVVHSHTHTEPYPSPTDVAQAPDPAWHYVIVGLKRDAPEIRSYRIRRRHDHRGADRSSDGELAVPLTRRPTGWPNQTPSATIVD